MAVVGKRVLTLNDYLFVTYNKKIRKVSLDIGATCPNRDGSKGYGGCIFCSSEGSASKNTFNSKHIQEQIDRGLSFYKKRFHKEGFIAYLQAFTPTYVRPAILHKALKKINDDSRLCGFAIASRSDTLNKKVISIINKHRKDQVFWLELGLQSIHAHSLEWMNRQETLQDFEDALALCKEYDIPVAVHVILGLPDEGEDEIRATAEYLSEKGVWGVKIHQLYLAKKTGLWRMFQRGEWFPYELEDYLDDLLLFLEHLDPGIVVHRFVADHHKSTSIFSQGEELSKELVLTEIEKEMARRDSFQGKMAQVTSTVRDIRADVQGRV